MAAEGHSPLDQFRIEPLVSFRLSEKIDLSYTNSALWMTLSVLAICLSFFFATKSSAAELMQ